MCSALKQMGRKDFNYTRNRAHQHSSVAPNLSHFWDVILPSFGTIREHYLVNGSADSGHSPFPAPQGR